MYFDKLGHILNLNLNLDNIIGSGFFSQVYKLNKTDCFKIINPKFRDMFQNREEVLDFIKEIDLDNVYKIKDFIYDENNYFSGYSMEFIKSEEYDMLSLSINHFIKLYLDLFNLVKEFSMLGIKLYDFKLGNSVINRDGIHIIDADIFRFDEPQNCFDFNNKMFKEYIIELLEHQYLLYNAGDLIKMDKDKYGIDRFKLEILLDKIIDENNVLGFIDELYNYKDLKEFFKVKGK